MTEADILAMTYDDSCTVYRPGKVTLPSGESVFKKGLEGRMVYEDIIEALMVNPYIEELSNFQFEQSGSGVRVEFDCTTVYGKDQITWEAKGVKVA